MSTPPSEVEELFEKFIRDKRYLKNLSSKTIDSYREVFGRWVRFVGRGMPIVELLEKFVVGMREAGFTITTCNISIRSFNSFLSWLYDNGHAGEHFKIKQVPGGKRVMRTFRDEDLRRVLDWRPDPKSRNKVRLHVLIYLLGDTVVRIDEALYLRVDGVDLENLVIKVRGKGDRERIVPVSIEMRKVLYRYLDKHRQTAFPSDYVFCCSTGTAWSYQNSCQTKLYEFQTRYSWLHQQRAEAIVKLYELVARVYTDLLRWSATGTSGLTKPAEEFFYDAVDHVTEMSDFFDQKRIFFDDREIAGSVLKMIHNSKLLYSKHPDIEHAKEFSGELADSMKEEADQMIRQYITPVMVQLRGVFQKLLEAETPSHHLDHTGSSDGGPDKKQLPKPGFWRRTGRLWGRRPKDRSNT
jgi:site-specific recombinase XerD